jgi:hypothetical protein
MNLTTRSLGLCSPLYRRIPTRFRPLSSLPLRRAEGLPLSKVVYVKRPEAMKPPQCVWDRVAVFAGVSPNRLVTIDTAEILEARRLQPQHLPPLAPTAARLLGMWHRAKG